VIWCDIAEKNKHLSDISREMDLGSHVIFNLEHAGWQANPKTPELNPVEYM
jgi:hypothetical protein